MALMLLPTRLASSILRTQGLSLAIAVERQLGHSISSDRHLHSTATPCQTRIFDQLKRPQGKPSTSILQHYRTHYTSSTSGPKPLRSASLRSKTSVLAQATSPSRNTATLAAPPSAEDGSDQTPKPTRPIVAYHLFLCAAMVYLIIVVGGLTRLTESGLSITEWNPGFKGMKLPWTDAEWDAEWEKYKGTPEWAM